MRARYAVGMGGDALDARVRPYAALRLDKTRTIRAFGREGVFRASMRACRFVPVGYSKEVDLSEL